MSTFVRFFVMTVLLFGCVSSNPTLVSPNHKALNGKYIWPTSGVLHVWETIEISGTKFTLTEFVHSPMEDPRYEGLETHGELRIEDNVIFFGHEKFSENDNRFQLVQNGREKYLVHNMWHQKYLKSGKGNFEGQFKKIE